VEISVHREFHAGVWYYVYTVANGSAFPIAAFEIGFNGMNSEAELALPPLGWTFDGGIPGGSVSAPSGWQASYTPGTEEDSLSTLRWNGVNDNVTILGGHTLGGFSIAARQPDSLYERSHWTAYVRSATETDYTGILRQETVTGMESDPMDRLGKLEVAPRPTSGAATIQFSIPNAAPAQIDIFDVQGHLVHALPPSKLTAGQNTIRWDGKLANGKRPASGVYFVRVKYGNTQRFARLVIAR
jgi:hypothetical protein